jgi:AraC-like DNA-binding protein/quercetin dioxygenase-like cupin family protein
MANYIGTELLDTFIIDKVYTIHYFEYAKGFAFEGEKHDFWELVYVDKGEVIVPAEDNEMVLTHGNIIFHKPGEWHNIRSDSASNTVIISFSTKSEVMKSFEGKVMQIGNSQKKLISKIITERINTFESPLGDPYAEKLVRKSTAVIGSEQLIKQYLCELFILLLRDDDIVQMSSFKNHITDTAFAEIEAYMNGNIHKNLSLGDIAAHANISVSTLREIFKRNASCGVTEYFINLKIEMAKKYIRDDNYNVTQIAELLGYSGPHYFSRQFRQKTGMSPLQYSKSIKSMVKEKL